MGEQPVHVCIGSARSGTTWLFNNLARCDDVFVPCVKEVRYWSGSRSGPERQRTVQTHRTQTDDAAQLSWLERWDRADGGGADYIDLMTHPALPSVDISPSYALMTPDKIRALRDTLPDNAKVVFFVRNPYDRALSQLKLHAFLHGKFRGPLSDGTFYDFAQKRAQRARGNYHRIIENWREVFGDQFGWFNFDRLSGDPEGFFTEVTRFLGLGPDGKGLPAPAARTYFGTDRKQSDVSILPDFTPAQKAMVAEFAMEDAEGFREVSPQVADRWLSSIRKKLPAKQEFTPTPVEVDWRYERLLRMTESLGDNCEFAFFQRSEGYEPSSLFRWAVTPVDALLKYLDDPAPLFAAENLVPIEGSDMVRDTGTGFAFHTGLVTRQGEIRALLPEPEFSKVHAEEKAKFDYLARRFHHFLGSRPGLFVLKANGGVPLPKVRALLAALRQRHPQNALLHVVPAPTYRLRKPEGGLYVGTIPQFAPYTAANRIEVNAWRRLMLDMSRRPELQGILKRMFV